MRRVVHVGGRVILFELPDKLPGIGRGGGVVYLYRLLRVDRLCTGLCSVAMCSTMVLTLLVFCFMIVFVLLLSLEISNPPKMGSYPTNPNIYFLTSHHREKGDQKGTQKGTQKGVH